MQFGLHGGREAADRSAGHASFDDGVGRILEPVPVESVLPEPATIVGDEGVEIDAAVVVGITAV